MEARIASLTHQEELEGRRHGRPKWIGVGYLKRADSRNAERSNASKSCPRVMSGHSRFSPALPRPLRPSRRVTTFSRLRAALPTLTSRKHDFA